MWACNMRSLGALGAKARRDGVFWHGSGYLMCLPPATANTNEKTIFGVVLAFNKNRLQIAWSCPSSWYRLTSVYVYQLSFGRMQGIGGVTRYLELG